MNKEEIKANRQFLRDLANASVILGNDLLDGFSTLSKALIMDVSIVEHIDTLGDWALEFVTTFPYNPDKDMEEQLYSKYDECWDVAVSNWGDEKVRQHFAKFGYNWDEQHSDWCGAGKTWDWKPNR